MLCFKITGKLKSTVDGSLRTCRFVCLFVCLSSSDQEKQFGCNR